jgi:putative YphP/YqiW family bacilliredoxin
MNNIDAKPPLYDSAAVQPMRDELTSVGFEEIRTPQMLEDVLSKNNDESNLVFINSVCGCAAGSARPGVILALQYKVIPNRFFTLFAGMDRDAIDCLRDKYLGEYPPSSPSMAIIKNGELVFMMPRHEIEGSTPEEVAEILQEQFDEHCTRPGPAISKEAYDKIVFEKACGSSARLN